MNVHKSYMIDNLFGPRFHVMVDNIFRLISPKMGGSQHSWHKMIKYKNLDPSMNMFEFVAKYSRAIIRRKQTINASGKTSLSPYVDYVLCVLGHFHTPLPV